MEKCGDLVRLRKFEKEDELLEDYCWLETSPV